MAELSKREKVYHVFQQISQTYDSANGRISFNTPSLFQGIPFDNISLTLENGLVVHAEAGDKTAELNSILDTDPARGGWGNSPSASIRPSHAPYATSCLTSAENGRC